jgi:hypothetical protein
MYRRPCFITPYHYRIDWLMWFAAFQQYHQAPWIIHLIYKLLHNDSAVQSLLAPQPFGDPFREMEREFTSRNVESVLHDARSACMATDSDHNSTESNLTCGKIATVDTVSLRPKFVRARLYEYQFAVTPETFLPTLYRSLVEEFLRPGHSLLDLALPAAAAYLRTLIKTDESPAMSLNRRNLENNNQSIPYPVDINGFEVGLWWKRKLVKSYIPAQSLLPQQIGSIQNFLKFHRFIE